MEISGLAKIKYLILIALIVGAGAIYCFFVLRDNNTVSEEQNQIGSLNTNLSPELEKLANNTVIYLAIKDSFVIPDGYKIDSQLVDKAILIYPKDQNNIQYNGLQSLKSFKGIYLTSGNAMKSEEMFNKTNEEKIQIYKRNNPESDMSGQITKDRQGNSIYIVKQTKPFEMIETILNKEYVVEIVSYSDTKDYQKIIDSYNSAEQIAEIDHKAIKKLQKSLVEGYEYHDANKVFALLSTDAQKNNPIEKIKKSVDSDVFKDMISLEPTALICFSGNFVMQSKVTFNDNYMSRLDISLKVDYDGKVNSWSIDSYTIKNKEKYLSSFELK